MKKQATDQQLAALQDIFQYSHDCVLIANFAMELLWCNRDRLPAALDGISCAELLRGNGAENGSGTYECRIGDETYCYRLLRYPTENGGYYVLSMPDEDAFYSFLHCRVVREFLENQTGTIRQAVTGISSAGSMLNNGIDGQGIADPKLLNVMIANCYRLLRSVSSTTELIRYAEEIYTVRRIDLARTLRDFTEACANLLRNDIIVEHAPMETMYIAADLDRLTACLLNLLLLAHGDRTENNRLLVTAKRVGDAVSIQILADSLGGDTGREHIINRTMPLYPDNELDTETYLIRRFCKTFGGTLYCTESADGSRQYSLRMPLSFSGEDEIECRSAKREYEENRFSCYHIALSLLKDLQFY